MVLGWRRAFCTSIPRDRDPPPPTVAAKQKHEQPQPTQTSSSSSDPSPKAGGRFGFFSNPSTPRLRRDQNNQQRVQQPAPSPSLRCRTTPSTATLTNPAVPVESPKLQCKTRNSPRLLSFSRSSSNSTTNPSSPRSPSTLSLLKSTLRLSKNRCGLCLQTVKAGQGMAIFTAECSHCFHFPCIAAHVKKQCNLVCPICSTIWKEMPILSTDENRRIQQNMRDVASPRLEVKVMNERRLDLKVYNDDESLMSPISGARFNPIPESDEENENAEFQGFFVSGSTSPIIDNSGNVDVRLSAEAAVVSKGRSSETYAIVLTVRAPVAPAKAACRAPIDLVTLLDISQAMTGEKLQMMKRAMRLVVSSLSSSDRLSIVAFSATSKRLLPLKRMTTAGRRSARRIIDAIAQLEGTSSASDALKKAAKVLEDRREKNTVASILLLSDEPASTKNLRSQSLSLVSFTRCSDMEIPVHYVGVNHSSPSEDSFAKCVGGLLSVVVQDLRVQIGFLSGSAPAEIAAVYSHTDRPNALGSGSLRLGDLYAEEEREFLVELKVPSSAIGAHHVLSIRSSYRDPSTQELIYGKEQGLLVPRPHAARSSDPKIQQLRNLFVTTRALAESRRLVERGDLTVAHHMLSSARALLLQSSSVSASVEEFVIRLESELSELYRRRQNQIPQIQRRSVAVHSREREAAYVDEKGEPLTPTSAWRAAERLAKVARMRKSLNRVSDLHGFEDARF